MSSSTTSKSYVVQVVESLKDNTEKVAAYLDELTKSDQFIADLPDFIEDMKKFVSFFRITAKNLQTSRDENELQLAVWLLATAARLEHLLISIRLYFEGDVKANDNAADSGSKEKPKDSEDAAKQQAKIQYNGEVLLDRYEALLQAMQYLHRSVRQIQQVSAQDGTTALQVFFMTLVVNRVANIQNLAKVAAESNEVFDRLIEELRDLLGVFRDLSNAFFELRQEAAFFNYIIAGLEKIVAQLLIPVPQNAEGAKLHHATLVQIAHMLARINLENRAQKSRQDVLACLAEYLGSMCERLHLVDKVPVLDKVPDRKKDKTPEPEFAEVVSYDEVVRQIKRKV